MDGIVDERMALRVERDPEDQPVEPARHKVERPFARSLRKPNRVDELRQDMAVIACKGQAPVDRRMRDIDFRRWLRSPCKRTEAIEVAGCDDLEYRSKGLE